MTQLEKLQLDYTTSKWQYNKSNEFSRDRHYNNMQKAWNDLKEYKLKHCPELLEQPKSTIKRTKFVRLDDQREYFEFNDYQ
jgi:hypothetical protein